MSVTFVVFAAAAIGMFAAGLFALAEVIAAAAFWRWSFAVGLKVEHVISKLTLGPLELGPTNPRTTNNTVYKVVSGRIVVFRPRFFTNELSIKTPVPVHGTVEVSGGTVTATGRIPTGMLAFFSFWAIGWTAGAVAALLSSPGLGAAMLVLGAGLLSAMVPLSLRAERRRFHRNLAEVLADLEKRARSTPRG